MICPLCKAINTGDAVVACVQCGSDLQIHQLLDNARQELRVKNEPVVSTPEPKKTSGLFIHIESASSLILFFLSLFVFFAGLHFFNFMTHAKSHVVASTSRADIELNQLQQMNQTIQQELALIVQQHQENQALQDRRWHETQQSSS